MEIKYKRFLEIMLNPIRTLRDSVIIFLEGAPISAILFLFLSILKVRKELRIYINGTRLIIRTATIDVGVAASCLRNGEFCFVKSLYKKSVNEVIIDAGGYIGTAAIAFAKYFPSTTILTLEPNSQNFRLLKKNVKAFPNIVPLNKALVSQDKDVEIFDRGTGDWGFTVVESPNDCEHPKMLHSIKGISFETLLKQFDKYGADILKLDIEGGEKDLFDNSADWISGIGIILADLHDCITVGCSRSFYRATEGMREIYGEGEKVIVVNEKYFK